MVRPRLAERHLDRLFRVASRPPHGRPGERAYFDVGTDIAQSEIDYFASDDVRRPTPARGAERGVVLRGIHGQAIPLTAVPRSVAERAINAAIAELRLNVGSVALSGQPGAPRRDERPDDGADDLIGDDELSDAECSAILREQDRLLATIAKQETNGDMREAMRLLCLRDPSAYQRRRAAFAGQRLPDPYRGRRRRRHVIMEATNADERRPRNPIVTQHGDASW
jgi:hypothetical protein